MGSTRAVHLTSRALLTLYYAFQVALPDIHCLATTQRYDTMEDGHTAPRPLCHRADTGRAITAHFNCLLLFIGPGAVNAGARGHDGWIWESEPRLGGHSVLGTYFPIYSIVLLHKLFLFVQLTDTRDRRINTASRHRGIGGCSGRARDARRVQPSNHILYYLTSVLRIHGWDMGWLARAGC